MISTEQQPSIGGACGGTLAIQTDEERWATARTLAEHCELTVEWLGGLVYQPGYLSLVDVDEDLAPGLTETLVALNGVRFMTTGSQGGSVCVGYDGARWSQAAAVVGLTTMATAEWFSYELVGTRFLTIASPVRRASEGDFYGTPVTWRDGVERTWFGPMSDLRPLPVDAEAAFTICDPVPGPNDLWLVLLAAAAHRSGMEVPVRDPM